MYSAGSAALILTAFQILRRICIYVDSLLAQGGGSTASKAVESAGNEGLVIVDTSSIMSYLLIKLNKELSHLSCLPGFASLVQQARWYMQRRR